MSPEKRVLQAIETAQNILARYVAPGPRNAEKTIDALEGPPCTASAPASGTGPATYPVSRANSRIVGIDSWRDEFWERKLGKIAYFSSHSFKACTTAIAR
jgi:hypothetical protein